MRMMRVVERWAHLNMRESDMVGSKYADNTGWSDLDGLRYV